MRRLAARLLLLLAVLLAPLGMTAAPALPMDHGSGASMPMQHCPEQQTPDSTSGIADCAMACAAALPTSGLKPPGRDILASSVEVPYTAARLVSRYLEIATPPPKTS